MRKTANRWANMALVAALAVLAVILLQGNAQARTTYVRCTPLQTYPAGTVYGCTDNSLRFTPSGHLTGGRRG